MKTAAFVLSTCFLAACADAAPPERGPGRDSVTATGGSAGGGAPEARPGARQAGPDEPAAGADRPPRRTDTLRLEGLPEPIPMRLVRAPADFPLGFSTYVPEDMTPRFSAAADGASMDIVAEFGRVRNERAFIHLYVFPPGTSEETAESTALAYEAGHGLPVSGGLEPLAEEEAVARMPWASPAYRFRYQAGGEWYVGALGIGRRGPRLFMLVRHYPAEYGDGFAPRADLVTRTWVWSDGARLVDAER